MNPQGTSFIPQRPVQSQATKKVVRKVYVLTYVSYVLFFGTVISAIGMLAYGKMLDSQLTVQKERLVEEEKKFDPTQIDAVRQLDNKIKTAAERMNMHLSVLPFFEALEQNISEQLLLKTFKYTRENDAAPQVELTGEVEVLNSLVFQREVLQSNPVLKGGEFSQVALASSPLVDAEGFASEDYVTTISFSLNKSIDASQLLYQPRVVFAEEVQDAAAETQAVETESEVQDEDLEEEVSI